MAPGGHNEQQLKFEVNNDSLACLPVEVHHVRPKIFARRSTFYGLIWIHFYNNGGKAYGEQGCLAHHSLSQYYGKTNSRRPDRIVYKCATTPSCLWVLRAYPSGDTPSVQAQTGLHSIHDPLTHYNSPYAVEPL